jgi:hypothetical protein
MKNPVKLIFLLSILLSTTNIFAINIETQSCIKSSKIILFSRSINAIDIKFKEHIRQKALSNIYTDFEAQNILKDRSRVYPKDLCKQDIILSLAEYSRNLVRNCTQNDMDFTVEDFSLELLNELSDKAVKSVFNAKKIRNIKLNKVIDEIQVNACPNSKHIKQVYKLKLTSDATNICHTILNTINSIKEDCSE